MPGARTSPPLAVMSCVVIALATFSCSEGGTSTNPSAGSGSARLDGGAAVDAARGRSTEVSQRDLAALERPDGVPPFRLTAVSESANRRSRGLNAQGLRLYRQRKYREAIAAYKRALAANPGHVLARYNLSCAYNLIGEPEKGLALLHEFKKAGCTDCRERLIRASEDADWHSMWDHPLFVEIVGVQVGDGERQKPFWQRTAGACPPGARLVGAPPPEGREVHCARGGTKAGPFARWNAKGSALAERGQYQRGRRAGVWKRFDPEGNLRETGPYRAGKKHGVWSEWHSSGAQAVDGPFVDGIRNGRWTWFADDGTILKQTDYTRGRRGAWLVAPKAAPE